MRKRPSRRRRFRGRFLFALVLLVALAGGVFLGWRRLARDQRLDELEQVRDELRGRLAALRARDPIVASSPEGDILIGVSEALSSDLVRRATVAFLSRVDIELRDIEAHKTGRVRVKTPVGRMTSGHYELDVRIRRLSATLEPGAPKVRFRGRRVDVEAPVRLSRGQGRAELRLRWDSRGIAGAFCPDFQARLRVDGSIVPRTYAVAGSFEGRLSDDTLTAVPSFPDLQVNLRVEPSAASWQALDRLLGERGLRCRAALKLVDIPSQIRRAFERGFDVKVPSTIIGPLSFPAGLRRELQLGGGQVELLVRPRGLTVTRKIVWYAADVATEETPFGTVMPAHSPEPGRAPAAGEEPTLTPVEEAVPTPGDAAPMSGEEPALLPSDETPEAPPEPAVSPTPSPNPSPDSVEPVAPPPTPVPTTTTTTTPAPEPPPTPPTSAPVAPPAPTPAPTPTPPPPAPTPTPTPPPTSTPAVDEDPPPPLRERT